MLLLQLWCPKFLVLITYAQRIVILSLSSVTEVNELYPFAMFQVFEFGVLAHSVIIGITIGVSNSPCTIEPLFAALTFHQFFEGLALGGCIAMVSESRQ